MTGIRDLLVWWLHVGEVGGEEEAGEESTAREQGLDGRTSFVSMVFKHHVVIVGWEVAEGRCNPILRADTPTRLTVWAIRKRRR